jgi:PAP2 superfamily
MTMAKVLYRDVQIELAAPKRLAGECETLLGYAALRQGLESSIFREANGAKEAATSVLAAIGLSTDAPVDLNLKVIRSTVIEEVSLPIDEFKRKFNRARPWTTCSESLAPMLMQPHWHFPSQPAYPSGHATVAWVFAMLFGKHAPPRQRARLHAAASQVALNREIAGVHFPSDSAAGKRLAEQLVKVMVDKRLPCVALIQVISKSLPS